MSAVAETLEAGSSATANYSNGVLTIGVPRGQDGTSAVPSNVVSSVNGETGDVVITLPTQVSDLTNDLGFTTASAVESALSSIISALDSAGGVVMTTDGSPSDTSLLRTYTLSQNGNTIGTINIPKDLVAISGEIVYQDGSNNSGTFIKLTIQNGSPMYIDVASLVEYNSVTSTSEIEMVESSSHQISATIKTGSVGKNKLATSVQSSLDKADTALQSAPVTSVNGSTGAIVINVPSKVSDLNNDSGFITSAPVTSVNGSTGEVVITVPSKVSELTNDSGFGTYSKPSGGIPASDLASGVIPSVPSAATATPADLGTAAVGSSSKYAKEDHVHKMPSASDVGALASNTTYVSTVNGSSGSVTITVPSTAADVRAIAAPSSPSSGQYLMWNGSAWVASALPTYNGGVS